MAGTGKSSTCMAPTMGGAPAYELDVIGVDAVVEHLDDSVDKRR
jgi:hypothetical protein